MGRLKSPGPSFWEEARARYDTRRQAERLFLWLVKRPRWQRLLPLLVIPLGGALFGVGIFHMGRPAVSVFTGAAFLLAAANIVLLVALSLQDGRDLEQRKRLLRRVLTGSIIALAGIVAGSLLFARGAEYVS